MWMASNLSTWSAPRSVCASSGSRGFHWRLFCLCVRSVTVGPGFSGVGVDGDRDFKLFAQSQFQFVAYILVFFEECARIFAALPHALATEADPRAALFQHTAIHADINKIALARNTFAIDNVELRFAEWRGHFILHDLGARARAHHFIAVLDRLDAPYIHAHGRIKL